MQGLPIEHGAPLKKGSFREANVRADHYLYYSPHDLELFFTGVKATKAYKQKPFVFTQLVYVGTRDEPEIKKFFHHMVRRFKDQLMDNKLEKLESLKHEKYIEQRKKNRRLYYSIFDTENLNPPRTLYQLQYLRSTSPPASRVFDTTVRDEDPLAVVHILPYTCFLDRNGVPIFMPCLLLSNSSESSQCKCFVKEPTTTSDSIHSSDLVNHEKLEDVDDNKQLQEHRELLNELFSSRKINLNKPTLFMGDSIEHVALTIFAATLAYGGGIFQYTATVLEDKLVANINRILDENARTKLVRDLDTRVPCPSKFPPQRSKPPDQSGSKAYPKSSNGYELKTTLYKEHVNKKGLKDNPELSSILNTKDFSRMTTKHQMIEDVTKNLLGIAPSIHQSSDSVDKFVKLNVYAPRYRQEDLDLIIKGLHPNGRQLSNTERFKLSLRLPIAELESRKIDYSDPATVTMILSEHINSVPSLQSKLVCTHSRGNMISRSVSPRSLAFKFLNAHKRLEQRARIRRVSECRFHWTLPTFNLQSQFDADNNLDLVDIANSTKCSLFTEKDSKLFKRTNSEENPATDSASLVHNILTRSIISPSKARIAYDIPKVTATYRNMGRLTFADRNFAASQSANRNRLASKTKINTHITQSNSQSKDIHPLLNEIDDYFMLLTEKHTCSIDNVYDSHGYGKSDFSVASTSPYSFQLRHCFSELIIVPSLVLSDSESSTPPSIPTSMVQHVISSPFIRFLTEKYGSKYFYSKASYLVLSANTMEYTFHCLVDKIVTSFRHRFVTLPESPTEWLMQSMTIRHLSQSNIYDMALSIYLTAEEVGLLQASHIKEYEIGRTRHYWDILCRAYSKH
ncbi:Hypothetical protein GLP15_4654 [Giardia lamblia P15]|uniref:Uncharacterized protein n=1 Tax=Giardia intestinalis (strain P15) TaxID=658858 RepID=E1F5R5_GIAIA|nr:Hypothetical protein GLP15_4654 [Giardia lamblia P15]